MYRLTNYDELKKTLTERTFKVTERYAYLEKAVDAESIVLSYAKNVFEGVGKQEIYLISKTKLFIVTWEPFVVKAFNIKDIVSTELDIISPYEITMKISFSNGDTIELNNKKDCNEDWETEYYEYILELNKVLSNL